MITTVSLKDALLDGAREVFETMVFMAMEESSDDTASLGDTTLLGSITFKGDLEGCLGVCCDEPCARTIAANMLGMPAGDELSENDVSDAIGEIANMVMGAVKARIQNEVGKHRGVDSLRGAGTRVEEQPGRGLRPGEDPSEHRGTVPRGILTAVPRRQQIGRECVRVVRVARTAHSRVRWPTLHKVGLWQRQQPISCLRIAELSDSAFAAFCEDIGGMFGRGDAVRPSNRPRRCRCAVFENASRSSRRCTWSKADGALNGTFHLVFDQAGMFVLSGVVVMLPESRIIEQSQAGDARRRHEFAGCGPGGRESAHRLVGPRLSRGLPGPPAFRQDEHLLRQAVG